MQNEVAEITNLTRSNVALFLIYRDKLYMYHYFVLSNLRHEFNDDDEIFEISLFVSFAFLSLTNGYIHTKYIVHC